jgi:hypothetical protein
MRTIIFLLNILLSLTSKDSTIKESSATDIRSIPTPKGFERTLEPQNSFAEYIRLLPLSNDNTVYLFDGSKKSYQGAQYAVLKMDIGTRDLQQCADAVMRIRAEYLYANQRYDDITFTFTSGDKAPYRRWMNGERPSIIRGRAIWKRKAKPDNSYATFRDYLVTVFRFCGTASLEKELSSVSNPKSIQIGDVIIKGGFPGHAVLVVDKAIRQSDNTVMVMLAQSYMPAQSIHILRNPSLSISSPWYEVPMNDQELETPEWTFVWSNLKRFE